ncbi:serine/threonine-protein kinase [Actinomadura hibisca]|uniref:serine/threonine-protein kinase n=1 Tax=Actinomadura hibisca TaxID=68565 RepID=UPI00083455D9|nr:serine/threonine-protein kinase [Actinomadura hibisca]
MPRLIAGRYELLELLGRGGMGAVWRARDRTLDREVAVKEVTLPRGLDAEQVERVHARTFREARSAARLDHPGIVTVHDVVEEDGRPWIVMRLVRAPALDDVLRRGGPLPPARTAAIGLDLLAALRAAHAAGVVHRDVKPGNVLLPPDRAVLTDFGIATVAGDETLTQAGTIVGSPAYLAPEQARHQKATPASDLWSLGATLYAAVEGRPPYQRPDVWGVMAALLADEPDPARNAGPLLPVLQGLLRKDPAQRMHPDEAERLLRQVAGSAPAWTPPTPPGGEPLGRRDVTMPPVPPVVTEDQTPQRPHTARWPLVLPAVVIGVALVASVLVVVLFTRNDDDPGVRPTTSPSPHTNASSSVPSSGTPSTQSTAVPAGYELFRNSAFAANIPKGWNKKDENPDATFTTNTKGVVEGFVVQKVANVPGNEFLHLSNAARQFSTNKSTYPDYAQKSLTSGIPYQEGQAAELEFTFTKNGRAGHCRVRVFSYRSALYIVTLATSEDRWTDGVTHFEEFLRSFRRP